MAPWASDVLRLDGNGNPRTLRLFASLVEAESRRFAAAAISQPAENDLVRAFRGGATRTVPIAEFLDCVQRCNYLFDGAVFVLAATYLALVMRSPAALEAGIVVEPATVHRLVSVAVLLGAKFSSPRYFERRVESIQICSGQSIRSRELCPLELLFLRALDYRMSIGEEEFRRFFRILERRPAPARSSVTCGATKRKAEEEEEPRRVRACQLAARYGISGFNRMEVVSQWRSSRGKESEDEKPELIADGKESEDEKPVLIADAGDQMFA